MAGPDRAALLNPLPNGASARCLMAAAASDDPKPPSARVRYWGPKSALRRHERLSHRGLAKLLSLSCWAGGSACRRFELLPEFLEFGLVGRPLSSSSADGSGD